MSICTPELFPSPVAQLQEVLACAHKLPLWGGVLASASPCVQLHV